MIKEMCLKDAGNVVEIEWSTQGC